MGVLEEEEEKGTFKSIQVANLTNLVREMNMKIHQAQRTPTSLKLNMAAMRHIKMKLSKYKDKERILKAARKKREGT